jgi:hypothetical protein
MFSINNKESSIEVGLFDIKQYSSNCLGFLPMVVAVGGVRFLNHMYACTQPVSRIAPAWDKSLRTAVE